MWRRKRRKVPPEDQLSDAEPLLAEIIPLVRLEPIVVPERLRKDKEKEEDEAKLKNILKNFLVGEGKARKKVKDIIKNA